jgi:predicted nucleotidyltransferase
MKIHQPLDGILRGRGSLALLRIFCHYPGTSFTGRELAKLTRLSVSHVQLTLGALETEGLVRKSRAGNSLLWSARPNNALFEPLRRLLLAEEAIPTQLLEDLRTGLQRSRILRATVFGSVSRAEETARSDVDLLVELVREADRPAVEELLLPLGDEVRERYGVGLSPLILTKSEARDPSKSDFLSRVRKDGKVVTETR